jgi:rubrerythrin
MEEITLAKAVQFAVTTEELGAKAYRHLAEKLKNDTEIAAIFVKLAEDEQAHEKYFRGLLEEVSREAPRDYGEEFEVLRAMSISQFFSSRDGLKRDIDSIKTREDALKRSFELEKATLGYYYSLKDALGKRAQLDAIIAAEKEHLVKVMQYMVTESKFRGLSDGFQGT